MLRRLDAQERLLAQQVFDHVGQAGEWPPFRTVERALAPRMHVEEVYVRLMPDASTWRLQDGTSLRLTTRQLLQLERIEENLAPLVRAFPVFVDRYLHAPKPEVTHEDLLKAGFTAQETMQVYRLLGSLGIHFRGSGGASPDRGVFQYELLPKTRQLQPIKTGREYLQWVRRQELQWERERRRAHRKERRSERDLNPWVKTLWIPLLVGILLLFLGWLLGRR